ncbi:MAG: hypothetical protein ABIE92_15595 [bacterium]
MLKPRETEDYIKGSMVPLILASICKDKLRRLKPDYIGIGPDANYDTESNVASISDVWKCHLANIKGETHGSMEWLRDASSVVSIHVDKACSFLTLENHQNVKLHQGYYSLFGSKELTVYDTWRDGKSAELYQIVTPVAPEKNDLFVLHDLYEFDFSGEEEWFIQNNNHLIPFLMEAKDHINRICHQDYKVAVHFVKDDEEDSESLFIVIKTGLSTDENLVLLSRLDDEWWLDVDYGVRKVLSLDIES